MKNVLAILTLIAVLPGAAALAQDQAQQEDTMMGTMNMRPGMEQSEADHGYMKAMRTMQQNMTQTEMTGDASGDFVRMMIPHHQSAIDMVDVLLAQKDVDPALKTMAGKMKADQTREIGEMKAWLAKRGP